MTSKVTSSMENVTFILPPAPVAAGVPSHTFQIRSGLLQWLSECACCPGLDFFKGCDLLGSSFVPGALHV
jgi:hypothetical protein